MQYRAVIITLDTVLMHEINILKPTQSYILLLSFPLIQFLQVFSFVAVLLLIHLGILMMFNMINDWNSYVVKVSIKGAKHTCSDHGNRAPKRLVAVAGEL